jgi:hypothetical protein
MAWLLTHGADPNERSDLARQSNGMAAPAKHRSTDSCSTDAVWMSCVCSR